MSQDFEHVTSVSLTERQLEDVVPTRALSLWLTWPGNYCEKPMTLPPFGFHHWPRGYYEVGLLSLSMHKYNVHGKTLFHSIPRKTVWLNGRIILSRCSRCHEMKPPYGVHSKTARYQVQGGSSTYCIDCRKIVSKIWYDNNKNRRPGIPVTRASPCRKPTNREVA